MKRNASAKLARAKSNLESLYEALYEARSALQRDIAYLPIVKAIKAQIGRQKAEIWGKKK